VFGPATLLILSFLLLLSWLARQTPLFLLALALLLAAGLSNLWKRYCLAGLEYRRRFSHRQVAFGETIELEIEIVNRKLLPLAWLEIEDEIPADLPPERGKVASTHKAGRAILNSLIALRPFERVRRRYLLHCNVRGEHVFGPVRLRTGDLFGTLTREIELELIDTLVVFPRVVPVTALGLPAHQPLGDRRVRSWLFEDPSRLVGAREYRPGDSLRRINWAASARTQQLQVKVYEPTTSHKLMLFLDLNTTPGDWWGLIYDSEALELSISTTASLAAWALAAGYPVGLATNGMRRYAAGRLTVEPTSSPAQLPSILESLGRLQPFAVRPFDRTLAEGARRLAYGTTVVVISAALADPALAELVAMRRRGHPVTIVSTGRQPSPRSRAGIAVQTVGPPEAWRELLDISLP
jgi:uncharacterized protein (DUF58 family)